jgi:hypothetical protein
MTSITTSPDSLQLEAETAHHLFDNWLDPIETEVRGRARQFIEEPIRSELDAALDRPRYGRGKTASGKERTGDTGHRHGSRTRSLTGTFGPIEIEVPRARLNTAEGDGMEEPGAAGLSAAHAGRRRADCEHLSRWHQYAPGSPRAWERLGREERPLAGRRADRAAHSRRHSGAGAARRIMRLCSTGHQLQAVYKLDCHRSSEVELTSVSLPPPFESEPGGVEWLPWFLV